MATSSDNSAGFDSSSFSPDSSSPTLQDTVEGLEEWETKLEEEYLEEEGSELSLQTDSELVRDLLTSSGDYNPIHFREGLEWSQGGIISDEDFQKFLDEVLEEDGIGQPHWNEERYEREIDKSLTGAVNPGMIYTTVAAMDVEGSIGSIESTWGDASWVGDHISLNREELDYSVEARTPESQDSEEKGSVRLETGDYGFDNNLEKIAAANQMVAREDRRGDMLLSLDINFYENTVWEELEWNEIEFVDEKLEDEKEIGNGAILSYGADIMVDDTFIGEASEMYVDTDNYGEIEEDYGSNPLASFFIKSATLPVSMATSTIEILSSPYKR